MIARAWNSVDGHIFVLMVIVVAAAEAGMSFRDLCLEILRLALDRPRS